jgi:hypothetical protein
MFRLFSGSHDAITAQQTGILLAFHPRRGEKFYSKLFLRQMQFHFRVFLSFFRQAATSVEGNILLLFFILSIYYMWAGNVARMGENRNAYRLLVEKPEGRRPLGRPRRRWLDNIRMDLV